jgi:hypothetical protein
MVGTEATRHRVRQPGKTGRLHLFISLTLNTFQSFGGGGGGSNSAYSGAGGDASGGSVNAYPALINILSNNGGDGGNAKSGDSFR